MTIICGMLTLDYAGVPTYVLTLTRELRRRGHRAIVYCPASKSGRPMSEQFDEVYSDLVSLPEPDAVLVHHRSCALEMCERFPNASLVFMAHGVFSGESAPSDVRVDRYVAINEQTVNRLTDQGVSPDQIDLVRDFVDTDRFLPGPSLRSDRPRVLFLSNYKKWNNYFFAFDACAALGLEFRAVGSPYGRSREVEQDIHQADLVVSWGRGILEAMACGRAVMSYDMVRFDEDQPSQVVGDGYLTIDRYHKAREHNFGPVGCRRTFMSAEDVAEEIQQYSPNDGPVNRELAVKYHGHLAGVNQLLVCIHKARGDYAC